jgi:hypothetical protein
LFGGDDDGGGDVRTKRRRMSMWLLRMLRLLLRLWMW